MRTTSISLAFVLATTCSLAIAGDPAGDWKWSVKRGDGKEIKWTAELKYSDGKLTGTIQRANDPLKKQIEIEDGEFKDGTVTFSTSEQGPGGKVVKKYNGKLDGDKISGKREVGGRSEDWEATRDK